MSSLPQSSQGSLNFDDLVLCDFCASFKERRTLIEKDCRTCENLKDTVRRLERSLSILSKTNKSLQAEAKKMEQIRRINEEQEKYIDERRMKLEELENVQSTLFAENQTLQAKYNEVKEQYDAILIEFRNSQKWCQEATLCRRKYDEAVKEIATSAERYNEIRSQLQRSVVAAVKLNKEADRAKKKLSQLQDRNRKSARMLGLLLDMSEILEKNNLMPISLRNKLAKYSGNGGLKNFSIGKKSGHEKESRSESLSMSSGEEDLVKDLETLLQNGSGRDVDTVVQSKDNVSEAIMAGHNAFAQNAAERFLGSVGKSVRGRVESTAPLQRSRPSKRLHVKNVKVKQKVVEDSRALLHSSKGDKGGMGSKNGNKLMTDLRTTELEGLPSAKLTKESLNDMYSCKCDAKLSTWMFYSKTEPLITEPQSPFSYIISQLDFQETPNTNNEASIEDEMDLFISITSSPSPSPCPSPTKEDTRTKSKDQKCLLIEGVSEDNLESTKQVCSASCEESLSPFQNRACHDISSEALMSWNEGELGEKLIEEGIESGKSSIVDDRKLEDVSKCCVFEIVSDALLKKRDEKVASFGLSNRYSETVVAEILLFKSALTVPPTSQVLDKVVKKSTDSQEKMLMNEAESHVQSVKLQVEKVEKNEFSQDIISGGKERTLQPLRGLDTHPLHIDASFNEKCFASNQDEQLTSDVVAREQEKCKCDFETQVNTEEQNVSEGSFSIEGSVEHATTVATEQQEKCKSDFVSKKEGSNSLDQGLFVFSEQDKRIANKKVREGKTSSVFERELNAKEQVQIECRPVSRELGDRHVDSIVAERPRKSESKSAPKENVVRQSISDQKRSAPKANNNMTSTVSAEKVRRLSDESSTAGQVHCKRKLHIQEPLLDARKTGKQKQKSFQSVSGAQRSVEKRVQRASSFVSGKIIKRVGRAQLQHAKVTSLSSCSYTSRFQHPSKSVEFCVKKMTFNTETEKEKHIDADRRMGVVFSSERNIDTTVCDIAVRQIKKGSDRLIREDQQSRSKRQGRISKAVSQRHPIVIPCEQPALKRKLCLSKVLKSNVSKRPKLVQGVKSNALMENAQLGRTLKGIRSGESAVMDLFDRAICETHFDDKLPEIISNFRMPPACNVTCRSLAECCLKFLVTLEIGNMWHSIAYVVKRWPDVVRGDPRTVKLQQIVSANERRFLEIVYQLSAEDQWSKIIHLIFRRLTLFFVNRAHSSSIAQHGLYIRCILLLADILAKEDTLGDTYGFVRSLLQHCVMTHPSDKVVPMICFVVALCPDVADDLLFREDERFEALRRVVAVHLSTRDEFYVVVKKLTLHSHLASTSESTCLTKANSEIFEKWFSEAVDFAVDDKAESTSKTNDLLSVEGTILCCALFNVASRFLVPDKECLIYNMHSECIQAAHSLLTSDPQIENVFADTTDPAALPKEELPLRLTRKIMLNARLFVVLMLQKDACSKPGLADITEAQYDLRELVERRLEEEKGNSSAQLLLCAINDWFRVMQPFSRKFDFIQSHVTV